MNKNRCYRAKPNGSGVGRLGRAFVCSMQGFKAAFTYESAFRQEFVVSCFLFVASFKVAQTLHSWLLLVGTLLFLLFAEIVNSAIEAIADKVCSSHDELIGRAKDLGSASVFIAMLTLGLTWSVYLYQFAFS